MLIIEIISEALEGVLLQEKEKKSHWQQYDKQYFFVTVLIIV